jgi:hypothetical protein
MTKILFNNQGAPLLAFGDRYFASTTGAPAKRPDVSKQLEKQDDKVTVDGQTIVSWGTSNDFPTKANELIRSVGVLNTGLKFIRNFTLGQGIFPCRVTGYDDQGNEQLQVLNDQKIINFCQGRMVRRYLEKAARDYLKYGKSDVQLIPNMEGTEMAGINTLNTIFSRYSEAKNGIIEKCIVSGRWPDQPPSGEFESFDLLDEYDPFFDLESRRLTGRIKGKSVIYSIRDSWSNNDYYSEPIWYSAYLAGWVDVARLVPSFLKKAFQNQITWKWHVQIPYAFWDRKFPATEYKDITARQAAIEEYMDRVEENLCGSDNADKPIFTFFEINPHNGKAEEQWIIEALDNKYKENDKLITSAAANSEILFSLMLNPNVLGAGMPGGTYAGNQGGSNIREAFLVNVANAWLDRQNLLDPLELFLQFNGVKDVQIRFRNTILTTLDTGAGTTKKLS